MIVGFAIYLLSYGKGHSDGYEKKDKDIEKMIVTALKKFNEEN